MGDAFTVVAATRQPNIQSLRIYIYVDTNDDTKQ